MHLTLHLSSIHLISQWSDFKIAAVSIQLFAPLSICSQNLYSEDHDLLKTLNDSICKEQNIILPLDITIENNSARWEL